MSTDLCAKRLTRELKALQKDPLKSPKIEALPLESNIREWHYVIEGSKGTPYEGGYYHGKLIFPKEYPMKPPSVIMLTPSGRFQPNRRLCLSMSDFHPESWNPMWSVSTILSGLYSFMVETGPTLGSINSTDREKRRYAMHSLDFNVRNKVFCTLFPDYVELHAEQVAERRRIEELNGVKPTVEQLVSTEGAGSMAHDAGEMPGLYAAAAGFIALLSIVFAMRFL